jgi:HK97 family phage major capsid protein/HK97 family phage prohead protease
MDNDPMSLPRQDLVRAVPTRVEVRKAEDGQMPYIGVRFARYGTWNEINSPYEGRFMERVEKGAMAKTFQENLARMRMLFQHGRDPVVGDKPVAAIEDVREDDEGPFMGGTMLDTAYNREILPGIDAGVYGASYRFNVLREDIEERPERSDWNPDGIPQRTIKEARVMEAGPVTFPAEVDTEVGVRSLTDWYRDTSGFEAQLLEAARTKPKELAHLIEGALEQKKSAPSTTPAAQATSTERRDPEQLEEPKEAPVVDTEQLRTKEDKGARITELQAEITAISEEHSGQLPPDVQTRYDEAEEALEKVTRDLEAQVKREQRVASFGEKRETVEPPDRDFQVMKPVQDIYNKAAVYRDARDPDNASQMFRDRAMKAVEGATFAHQRANQEDAKGQVEKLLKTSESQDAEISRRILTTGSPTYRRALGKAIKAGSLDTLTSEERTVMAEGAGATGGFAITFDLDPTIVKTSSGAVNPFRRACRVVSISGTNEWRGVSSGAVVATYEAEATEAVDRSPTLAQPAFITKRAQTFIPFSIELDQDWGALQSEMAGLIQDSKDVLEATQFATGLGTGVLPQGIVVGMTNTATTGTTTVLAVNDIYKTEEALPPRFRDNAQWFANRFWYNKVRQLDTAGGANLWVPDLRTGIPANETGNTGFNLIGYPANESSAMVATLATTVKEAVLMDPSFYVIVERVGLDIELIPHLFGLTANYPSGQRGVYAMWRNTARVFDPAGGITLVGL